MEVGIRIEEGARGRTEEDGGREGKINCIASQQRLFFRRSCEIQMRLMLMF